MKIKKLIHKQSLADVIRQTRNYKVVAVDGDTVTATYNGDKIVLQYDLQWNRLTVRLTPEHYYQIDTDMFAGQVVTPREIKIEDTEYSNGELFKSSSSYYLQSEIK